MTMNKEKANYTRIQRLLVDIGTVVYRQTFISRFPHISSYEDFFQPFENKLKRLLNECQREILFPNTGKYKGNLTDLDISVLYILLRNISNITPHKNGWGEDPDDTDRSLSANIERIRLIRNKYVGHSPKSSVSEPEFKIQWAILRQSILELPGGETYKEQVDELLTTSLDPDNEKMYKSALEVMRKNDKTVTKLINLFEAKSSVMEKDTEAVKREHQRIKDTMSSLQNDTEALQTGQKSLADKTSELLKDTKSLQRKQKKFAAITDEKIKIWKAKIGRFVETSFSTEVFNALQTHQIVLLTGSSGSGKTATAYFVAQQMEREGYIIRTAKSPVDLIEFVSGEKEVYIFDDVFGKISLNLACADLWDHYETEIEFLLRRYLKVKLILTSRPQIEYKNCSTLHLSEHNLTLSLKERRLIASRYMSKSDADNIDDKTILMYQFFPLLCQMYADNKLQNIEDLFTTPSQFIHVDLKSMSCKDPLSYLALSFLVVRNNKIEIAKLNGCSACFEQTFRSIYDEFEGKIDRLLTRVSVLSKLEKLQHIYTAKVNGNFKTIHDKMFDILSAYFGPKFIQSILLHGSINFIADRMLLKSMEERQEENIILVPENFENMYFDRMLRSVTDGKYWQGFGNIQSKNSSYRKKFLSFLDGQEIQEIQPLDGIHPLYVSSFLGYIDFVQYLIEHARSLINLSDSIGRTPLYAASRNGFQEIAQTLILNGADVNTCTTDGWSPLIIATHKGHLDIVMLLLKNGAKTNANETLSPLYIACQNGFCKIAKFLLNQNCSVTFKNSFGWTALHIACQNGHTRIVEMLVKARCDTNAVDHKKCSALDIARANNRTEIVEFLRGYNMQESDDMIGLLDVFKMPSVNTPCLTILKSNSA